MNEVCPKCRSDDVFVGGYVLSCNTCGWTAIGENPCRTCGDPAVGFVGGSKETIYYCRLHPLTQEEEDRVFRPFAEMLLRRG